MSHHQDMLEVLDRLMGDLAERGVPGELDAPDHEAASEHEEAGE